MPNPVELLNVSNIVGILLSSIVAGGVSYFVSLRVTDHRLKKEKRMRESESVEQWFDDAIAYSNRIESLWETKTQKSHTTDQDVRELNLKTGQFVDELRDLQLRSPDVIGEDVDEAFDDLFEQWEIRQERLVAGIPEDMLNKKGEMMGKSSKNLKDRLKQAREKNS